MPHTRLDKDLYSKQEVEDLLRHKLESLQDENQRLRQYSQQLVGHLDGQGSEGVGPISFARQQDIIAELREISRHINQAIHDILSGMEKVEIHLGNYIFSGREDISQEILSVMESCNVQDITTQRIQKILAMLGDKSVPEGYRIAAENEHKLESGPAKPGTGITQEEIDRLLNS